jgi:acyl carrier protein
MKSSPLLDITSHDPDRVVVRHLPDQSSAPIDLTARELLEKASGISERLIDHGLSGQRVLLTYLDAPSFLPALYGCWYAGVTPVPVQPPHDARALQRISSIVKDCGAKALLSNSEYTAAISKEIERHGAGIPCELIDTTSIASRGNGTWTPRMPEPDELALLQYTSGSTAEPRGVMVSFENITTNIEMMRSALLYTADDRLLTWLPLYHDMGLIGGLLKPIFLQIPCFQMTPNAFLREPFFWLDSISRYRATVSGCPNFALELCLRKIPDEKAASLDLSSLRLLWNGAEPIRKDSLERFAEKFAPYGFRSECFYPCYGLAEATVFVTGSDGPTGFQYVKNDNNTGGLADTVCCGHSHGGTEVRIIDPESCQPSTPGAVGEIWIKGPAIARGYWNKQDETGRVFEGRLKPNGDGPYLRTGDLGFQRDGELYIAGRLKDLIIIRGRNVYPQDVEFAVERSHPHIRPGCSAAFSVEAGGEERLVIAAEVARGKQNADLGPVVTAIRRAVVAATELQPWDILIVEAGTIPKTSSGKIQRGATRAAYQQGLARPLAQLRDSLPGQSAPPEKPPATTHHAQTNAKQIEERIRIWLAKQLNLPKEDIGTKTHFADLNVDSLRAAELLGELEDIVGYALPDGLVWNYPNLESLATYIASQNGHGQRSSKPRSQLQPHTPLTAPGPLEGTIAISRTVSGADFRSRVKPFTAWRDARNQLGIWPYMRVLHGEPANEVECTCADGSIAQGINFASIDYLGLSSHPMVKEAAIRTIREFGVHSGSVPIFSGSSIVSQQLAAALGDLLELHHVLLFPTGWTAGWGAIAGLVREYDHIVIDELAHNCMQRGAKTATRNIKNFRHNSCEDAQRHLQQIRSHDVQNAILVVTEGLFSMDSDWPDLAKLQDICHEFDAHLLVDISHDIGSMGPGGTGQLGLQGLNGKIDFVIGGLSKVLGANGGFLACNSKEVCDYLTCASDAFLFGTAFSPISAAIAMESIRIVRTREGQQLRDALMTATTTMRTELGRAGLTSMGGPSPILPALVGPENIARLACKQAFDRGVITNLVEYPAVPLGMARFRLQLMAQHGPQDVARAALILGECVRDAAQLADSMLAGKA